MKILVIDIETTGLNHEKCSVLEIAKCYVDTRLDNIGPVETRLVYDTPGVYSVDKLHWEATARKMHQNSGLYERWETSPASEMLYSPNLWDWLVGSDKIWSKKYKTMIPMNRPTLAGKSLATFDMAFLSRLPNYTHHYHQRRILDINACFIYPHTRHLSTLGQLAASEGFPMDTVAHHKCADDCLMTAWLLRKAIRRNAQ